MFSGTGKTRTIVAAITEIISTTENCILVCANSNAACDELAGRLIKLVPKGTLLRMYAKSVKLTEVDDTLKRVCNLVGNEFKFPSLAYLYTYRIVVCTLLTAGVLVRARSKDKSFDPSHFSHIFIDEAACVPEPISLIAVAGMTCFKFNWRISYIISVSHQFFKK